MGTLARKSINATIGGKPGTQSKQDQRISHPLVLFASQIFERPDSMFYLVNSRFCEHC